MSDQRELIDNPKRSWVLSEEARRTGLEGVRRARAALQDRSSAPQSGEEQRTAA